MDTELDMDKLNETKRWLFNERVTLERERKELEEEIKLFEVQKELILKQKQKIIFTQNKLEAEKMLYDKKWTDLDLDKHKFENEKKAFLDEQQVIKKQLAEEKKMCDVLGTDANPKLFFKGIRNGADLRRRYKELTKIYHPDNDCGSSEVIMAINEEYESLKRHYIG